jgi:kumamolisin
MKKNHFGLRAGVAFGALALALSPILGEGAGASGTSPTTLVPVSQGINIAAVPGATVFGPTPPSTPETVSFILDERNVSQLEQSVDHGINQFDSVSQFAQEYGQSQSNVSQLESFLGQYGISTQVYAGNVDVVANGTAGQFDKALSDQQNQYHVPGFPGRNGMPSVPAQTVHAPSTAPELPYQISQYVLSILGLANYAPFVSQAVQINTTDVKPQKGSSSSCLALTGLPNACNTPANFEQNYGLSQLESQGANGHGQTLAIVTLAAIDPGAPQYFWNNIANIPNTGRSLTVQNVDGGPGAPTDASGSGETDLDVEQSGGVAPGANVIVYQAPNTDSGFIDGFFQAASQNVASSISSSWGESETYIQWEIDTGIETTTYQASFDEAFLEMAAQGQSGFVSAGDSGAYDASGDLGTTNLSVDSPGDSPYITVTGGTTLPWNGTLTSTASGASISANVQVNQQRAWGWDYLWQPVATITASPLADVAESLVVGGGGGFSTNEPVPSYQQGVSGTQAGFGVQYLTPASYTNVGGGLIEPTAWNFNPKPNLTSVQSTGRALPDVSTDGDPYTGYLLYEPSFATIPVTPTTGPEPVLQGGWGGTSFVAPQLNGSTAVIDSYLGHRVGFWNPSIYSYATSRNSPFTPLQVTGTSNDNIFFTGNPGSVYNESTGLGIPNLTSLAHDFSGSSGSGFGGLGGI